MKNCLSVEQSAELIKRGVKADRASMSNTPMQAAVDARGIVRIPRQPIFTLTDLLSLLPVDIYYEHKTYELAMRFIFEKWHVEYSRDNLDILAITHATELIDALYEMVLWCLDNNHVKLD